MTSIAYDFKAIKHRIDQMNGEATSGTYYRQDESGKVEVVADGHDWIGLLDRCARCGYYVAELHDNLAPKVCPGKIDGEPCSECGKNAVVNLQVATPHFHASRCLACGYLWREYSEAEKARQAERAKAYERNDLLPGFTRVLSPSHNWQTRGDITDCTVCGYRPDETAGMDCRGYKPSPKHCTGCTECGNISVVSFGGVDQYRYSRCFSCRHSFYPVPAPKRKEWVPPAITAKATVGGLLSLALGRMSSQRYTVTNKTDIPAYVNGTEVKPGKSLTFKNGSVVHPGLVEACEAEVQQVKQERRVRFAEKFGRYPVSDLELSDWESGRRKSFPVDETQSIASGKPYDDRIGKQVQHDEKRAREQFMEAYRREPNSEEEYLVWIAGGRNRWLAMKAQAYPNVLPSLGLLTAIKPHEANCDCDVCIPF